MNSIWIFQASSRVQQNNAFVFLEPVRLAEFFSSSKRCRTFWTSKESFAARKQRLSV